MTQTAKKASLKVNAFGFSAYPVTDFERARKFYEEVLNLEPGKVNIGDNEHIFSTVEYYLGDSTLMIITYPSPKPGPGGPTLALEVENFDEAVQALRDNGVTFTLEPFDTTFCCMAGFTDPDGNPLMIHKINPNRPEHI